MPIVHIEESPYFCIVFQSLEGLHKAIPNHPGDWSGHYPTPGGERLLMHSYIQWYEMRQL